MHKPLAWMRADDDPTEIVAFFQALAGQAGARRD